MLRDYQATALTRLRQSLARGNLRPMVQAPTGAGKTRLATAIVTGALAKSKRVIFCVPAIDLIDQTAETFWAQGIRDIGVMQGNHAMTDPSRPVQIASMQTLMRRSVPPADLVIIDEAHRWFDFTGRWMRDWSSVPFVGLSATPWTKGLGKHYDDLIVVTTTADLIQRGFLSPFRVYAPPAPDLSKCRTVAGDYHEGDLSEAMDQPAITADVVSTWLKLGEDRPTLCFAVDRAHAQHLAERFNAAGISTAYIDAFTTREERQAVRKQFQSGAIRVVCNVGCLTTGVDWDVRCIVLARPTKSEILFTQIIGRGLRAADGKADCMILDHTSTHERLGFVTDIQHSELDTGKHAKAGAAPKKPDERLPKSCPSCTYLKPVGVHACPACGFAPQKSTAIVESDGDLHELTKGQKTRANPQAFFSALIAYAQDRGIRDGWVAHTYREYFGVWPQTLNHVAGPMIPECRNFIKYKQIAYAKRRSAA